MSNALSVTNWATIMGYSPWQTYGFNVAPQGIPSTPCLNPIPLHTWQDADFTSRETIVNAIERAESIMQEYLGYAVAPRYGQQTLNTPPRAGFSGWSWGWGGLSGIFSSNYPAVQTDEGFIQSLGVEALTLVQADVAVAYTDEDGDGIKDTFTLGPIATTETDPLIFRVYNSLADRFVNTAVSDQWLITPIKATITAGMLTITGPRWLCGVPKLYEALNWTISGLNPLTATNFVTTLDIYTSQPNSDGTTVPTAEAVLIWERSPWSWCCGPQPTTLTADPAALQTGFARGNIRVSRNAWSYEVYSVYNATTQSWSAAWWLTCSPPSRMIVRYLAGLDVDRNVQSPWYGQMQRAYQTVVARLAAAQLTRPPAGCESAATRELAYWQVDTSQVRGKNEEIFSATREQLNNPIGPRRGEIQAWKFIENQQRAVGVTFS